MHKQLLLCLLAATALSAAPVIRPRDGVLNAASYIPLGTQGSGIAQGSYFVIFGSGLGPTNIVVSSLPFQNNLSVEWFAPGPDMCPLKIVRTGLLDENRDTLG